MGYPNLCELPDTQGRFLSQWDCAELARQVVTAGLVGSISASTVRRILKSHQLKPWRHHLWRSPKFPRDKAFVKRFTYRSDFSQVGRSSQPVSLKAGSLTLDRFGLA